eukprot:6312516-Amphidinium_carterae.1
MSHTLQYNFDPSSHACLKGHAVGNFVAARWDPPLPSKYCYCPRFLVYGCINFTCILPFTLSLHLVVTWSLAWVLS